MGKCLILLTNYYPFYKGEEYLESEISYLSDSFEKIFVIPTMVNNEMKVTRSTPTNVDVVNINYNHTTISKIKNTVKQYKGEPVGLVSKKFKCRLYQNYFNNRSQQVFNLIEEKLLLEKKINNQEYSEAVIYSYWLYTTSQVGVLLKNTLRDKFDISAKLISRAHRYDLYENEAKLNFLPSREFLLKNNDYVYPCSDDGTLFLKNTYPMYASKIKTRRLGVFSKGKNSFDKETKFEIVSCSAMRPIKRINLIVDALNYLEQKKINYHWTHFGDGKEFTKVKNMAENLLTKENYSLKGFVNNSDVIEYYNTNSVGCFINVSESEGIPVSIMEAASFSIPIIATDVGGTKEIVFDDVNGTLLPKDFDIDYLEKKIIDLISKSEKEYEQLRTNSYSIWLENYSSNKNYFDFSKEINNI